MMKIKEIKNSISAPNIIFLSALIIMHYVLSAIYTGLLPWGGDEWYTYYNSSIMALPNQLLVNILKLGLGELNMHNYILYRQVGAFFTATLFLWLLRRLNSGVDQRHFVLFSLIYLALSSFILFQEQMFRYYGMYLAVAFLYFYFQLKYLECYHKYRWLFYLLLIISPFLHFFQTWQLFFYILFQEYRSLASKKALRKMILFAGISMILLLAYFWKTIMSFILPLVFQDMKATGLELRGFSFGMLFKPFIAIFQFLFGYDVVPTENLFVAVVLIVFLVALGITLLKMLQSRSKSSLFVLFTGIIPFILMYLLLEPLTLPGSTQFESKHALFFIPFLILIASQASGIIRKSLIGSGFISLTIGLGFTFLKSDFANWNTVSKVGESSQVVITDGRARQTYEFYQLNADQRVVSIWDTASVKKELESAQKLCLVLNDFKSFGVFDKSQIWNTGVSSEGRFNVLQNCLRLLRDNCWQLKDGYVKYPTMAYAFEKGSNNIRSTIVPDVYPMTYKNLDLPRVIEEDTIVAWKIYTSKDTLFITDTSYYYFLHVQSAGSTIGATSYNMQENTTNELTLNTEKDKYRSLYCRAFETYSQPVFKWHRRPLMSASFAYPGSKFPGNGYIFQFKKPAERKNIDFIIPASGVQMYVAILK